MIPADVRFLAGRSYVTKSGMRCKLSVMGDGALAATWDWHVAVHKFGDALLVAGCGPESAEDREEVNTWITDLVLARDGGILDLEVCNDERQQAEAYAAWKKKLEGGS